MLKVLTSGFFPHEFLGNRERSIASVTTMKLRFITARESPISAAMELIFQIVAESNQEIISVELSSPIALAGFLSRTFFPCI